MSDSLFSSLLNTLDKRTVSYVAGALGQPEQLVSRGAETSITAILAGLVSKSRDPNALRKILDTGSTLGQDVSWSSLASGVFDPNSSLMTGGKRVLSSIFGNGETAVTNAISRESGLGHSVTSTLMSMAAPVVMSLLGKRIRDDGLDMNSLASMLQHESGAIRAALPAGLRDIIWPAESAASPVVTQTTTRESTSSNWLPALALAGLALGMFWFFSHARRPVNQQIGTASRMATGTRNFIIIERMLPNRVNLRVPENGVETRLLAFIQDPGATPNRTTWLNFDRLTFDAGSKAVGPESQEQLNNIAAILVAYPRVRLKVGGYTDNVGISERNLQLSRDRANAVVAELVGKGIAPDRLSAEGYGEQYPVADNSTEEGRIQNRRVAMSVTEK